MNLQRLLIKLIFTAFAMTFILACQQDDMGRQVADKDIDRHDTIAQVDNRSQLNELQSQNEMLLSRSRFTTGGVAMILGILALLAFLTFNSRWTRRLEIKNQQLQREHNVVISQNKQLALERDRAEAASLAKTAFIRSMTHEIRTPLNAISGFSQILLMDDAAISAEDRKEMGQRIIDGTRMLTSILDDLILISDYESRTEPSPLEDCFILSVIDQSVAAIQPLLSDKVKIENRFSVAPDLMVKTNPTIVQNVLEKLLHNAAKFTQEGHITLTTDLANGQLHFAVSDTGSGIPADKHEYVFERFAKIDSFSQGAGLGLTVARMLAEHLGGSLTIDADYHDGAKFDFIIPIA
jgi:signal transduction histidine kinase